MAAIAYFILQPRITVAWAPTLLRAVGRDWKGKISPALYIYRHYFGPVVTHRSQAYLSWGCFFCG
jgi:hypothetical protein